MEKLYVTKLSNVYVRQLRNKNTIFKKKKKRFDNGISS